MHVQVKVIEKTNEFRRFGGPIQLASNALSTIKAIDPEFFDKVMEYFTFTGIRTNGIKDGIRTEWCVRPSIRITSLFLVVVSPLLFPPQTVFPWLSWEVKLWGEHRVCCPRGLFCA